MGSPRQQNASDPLASMTTESDRYVLVKTNLDGSAIETQPLKDLQEGLERMKQLEGCELECEYYLLDTVLKKKLLATPDPSDVT